MLSAINDFRNDMITEIINKIYTSGDITDVSSQTVYIAYAKQTMCN